jgi:sensor histidine kinase regulating citrate/malate metabolism
MVDILPLAMLVFGLTIIDATLAVAAFTRSRRLYRHAFVALMAMEIVMAWGYLLDVNAPTLSEKLLWNNLEYVGYLGAVPVSFMFSVLFIGSIWMTRKRMVAMLVVPIALWVSLALNQFHHLFYVETIISNNQFISFSANYGPIFYAYVAFTLAVIFAAVGILISRYHHTAGQHRKHVGIVMLATMIPLAVTVLNFVAVTQLPGPFLVIAGLFVSGILLYIGAFGFEMFEIVPFAFDQVVGTINDSVFILDEGDSILFMNQSASELTGRRNEDAFHLGLCEIVPGGKVILDGLTKGRSNFCFESNPGHFYEASVRIIKDPGQRSVGKLVILHEVTENKRASDLAKEAEDKTKILNSITRHDINNQLLVIDGNAELLRAKLTDEGLKKHLTLISLASKNISQQLAFLRDYQEIGIKDPSWQKIDAMLSQVQLPLSERGIKMQTDTRNAEILADPQLEKVFYNLIDNSLTHGVGVALIKISIKELPDSIELIYEDDGNGISKESRKHLFEMSEEGDHGAGLFLSKKILAITDMTIHEEGEPGKGVRFVIRVQRSKIRFALSPPGAFTDRSSGAEGTCRSPPA